MIDSFALKILKHVMGGENITSNELRQKFGDQIGEVLDYLAQNGYLKREITGYEQVQLNTIPAPCLAYRITTKGRSFIQNRKVDAIKYWVPIAISNAIAIAALVVAIVK